MNTQVLGIHHITAISASAQKNYNFYTAVLGLRMVKRTVNFDDPGTYHFYYGNKTGEPGSILTFFPWESVEEGYNGAGMATGIAFSVPEGSLNFWKDRFQQLKIKSGEVNERFGKIYLPFSDPDGLKLALVASSEDQRAAWSTTDISEAESVKGFEGITLTLSELEPTTRVLTDLLGYKQVGQERNRYRFTTDTNPTASIVDIILDESGSRGYNAGGTIHHVAFRVKDEAVQMNLREQILSTGLSITKKIDRNYFYSLYFREPGGVLFEIATDNPGFAVDEKPEELGTHLMLPDQFEESRGEIEKVLPKVEFS